MPRDITAHPLMRGRFDVGSFSAVQAGDAPGGPASIHADARGELFLTTTSGGVDQIAAGP